VRRRAVMSTHDPSQISPLAGGCPAPRARPCCPVVAARWAVLRLRCTAPAPSVIPSRSFRASCCALAEKIGSRPQRCAARHRPGGRDEGGRAACHRAFSYRNRHLVPNIVTYDSLPSTPPLGAAAVGFCMGRTKRSVCSAVRGSKRALHATSATSSGCSSRSGR